MSDLMEFTGMADVFSKLDASSDEFANAIKQLYGAAASVTMIESQSIAPVRSGDMRNSAHIDMEDNGSTFSVEVTYGDGNSMAKTYNYSPGDASTQYPADSLDADGYPWMVELGHLSRSGTPVPAQPFLGPSFDRQVQNLESDLKSQGLT